MIIYNKIYDICESVVLEYNNVFFFFFAPFTGLLMGVGFVQDRDNTIAHVIYR